MVHKICEKCDPPHSRLGHRSDKRSVPAGCTPYPKEDAMPNRNLWNRNVPRVEYDHRAREARLRLEYTEPLFVKRDAGGSYRYFRLLLFLLGKVAGNGGGRGRRAGSPSDRRPRRIGTLRSVS